MKLPLWHLLTAPLVEPYARYQYADILHGVRLGCAVVLALLINKITQLPHGEWTSITVFIILGLLQYQGAIYTKAKERVLGTLLGIAVGLILLWVSHGLLGYLWLYYALIGVISGVIGYYAIKQLGYIGLLTGITMMMIISSTSSVGEDGLYRALNVLIGTIVAVAATLILPLKSTLMWRFLLANNLEACADIYAGVGTQVDVRVALNYQHTSQDSPIEGSVSPSLLSSYALPSTTPPLVDESVMTKAMGDSLKTINKRLLTVRSHIAATASESGIDKATLELIQRTHRNIIGTIDLLLTAAPKLSQIEIDADNRVLLIHYQHELTQAMRHMAAVLRSPSDEVFRPITRITVSDYPSIKCLAFEWQGYFWLTQTLQGQLQLLSDLLREDKPKWFAASGLRYQRREQRRIHVRGAKADIDV